MWEPELLTTLWASKACYRDTFTLLYFTFMACSVCGNSVEIFGWAFRCCIFKSLCILALDSWELKCRKVGYLHVWQSWGKLPKILHSTPVKLFIWKRDGACSGTIATVFLYCWEWFHRPITLFVIFNGDILY
jgi:hypothetical protein